MPYEIRGNCVHRQGDDKPLKCYDNHEDALKYLRALEVNVEDAKELDRRKLMLFTQEEVNYVTLSPKSNKACANCRFFIASGTYGDDGDGDNDCHIVCEYPDAILPTGYCDRWEAMPTPEPIEQAPIPVMIVEPEETVQMEANLFERIWQKIDARLHPAKEQQAFTVFKDKQGNPHWIARYTNNFQDLDGEIISEKALNDYIVRVNMKLIPMPELWDMHIKGTRHGQADEVFGVGHFVYAIGHYDDTPMGKAAATYDAKHAKEYELSHGFTAPEWAFKEGIYQVANTFEITKLPKAIAKGANPFTSFEEIEKMQITAERERHLREVYGDTEVDNIKAEADKHGKQLEALGVAYKDYSGVTPENKPQAVTDTDTKELMLELMKAQGEFAEMVTQLVKDRKAEKEAVTKEQSESQQTIKALREQIADIQKTLNMGGQPASRASNTEVAKEIVDKYQKLDPNQNPEMQAGRAFLFGGTR